MKKIAFVSTMRGSMWGGSEELWSKSARYLARNGVLVAVNVDHWRRSAEPFRDLERAGCEVTYRHVRRSLSKILGAKYVNHVYDWIGSVKADIVVISQGNHLDGLTWMQACKDRAQPFVAVAQAVREIDWPGNDEAHLAAELYESAQRCYFVSRENTDLARAMFATPLPNAEVVWNPFNVDYDRILPWPTEEDGALRVACVGRLYPPEKGQDLLFRALSSDTWRNRSLEVDLFGAGPGEDTLKRLAAMYHLEGAVRFRGQCPDISSVWQTHHALVLTSRSEGLPLSVVEAMLCGRPCIVTDVAGNIEVVEDEITGFVATGAKANRVAEALERAWQRRTDWCRMGQAAAHRIREIVPPDPAAVFAERLLQLV